MAAIAAARDRRVRFVLIRTAVVNPGMEIDSGGTSSRSFKHQFQAPERRAQRIAHTRLALVVNGIRLDETIRQSVAATVMRELFQYRPDSLI